MTDKTKTAEEIWKDVIGYEGSYKVSDIGNVKSLERYIKRKDGVDRLKPEMMLKQTDQYGYKNLGLSKNGKSKHMKVHRLVAMAFIPNPLNKPMVNHINGIKNDNRLENLEWATAKENVVHAHTTGIYPKFLGGKNANAKKVIDTRNGKIYDTMKEAAESNGINKKTLSYRIKVSCKRTPYFKLLFNK